MYKMISSELQETDKWRLYCCRVRPRAYLFDALLVLNEQLHTWDVNVEPWSLRRALHWSVYTAIVLAAYAHMETTHRVRLGSLLR